MGGWRGRADALAQAVRLYISHADKPLKTVARLATEHLAQARGA